MRRDDPFARRVHSSGLVGKPFKLQRLPATAATRIANTMNADEHTWLTAAPDAPKSDCGYTDTTVAARGWCAPA